MNTRKLNIFLVRLKAILSTLIVIVLIPVVISSIGLYLSPSGRRAGASGFSFLGLSKFQLETLHNIPGIILISLFVLHFLLNIRLYSNEIKCLLLRK